MEHKLSATLELRDRFTTRINNANYALKRFEKSSVGIGNKLNSSFDKAFSSFEKHKAKMGAGLRAIERGVMIGGAAVGAFLTNAYSKYANLHEVLTKNAGIMGANVEEQAKLQEQVMQLGRTTKFTATQVAEAQKYQAMAGYKTNQILAATPKILKLSIASGEDLARTSDIVTDNLDAFGMKLTDIDRLMDVMAATANNTNTSIGMLGEAYQYVGAASRQFDSFEEVNTILGILANNGIKGAKAGRNLAAIYARLSKLTPDMKKELEKTNTTLYDQNGHFKGLRKIIEESKPALDRMTEAQRNQWLATIAGTEGLKVWSSISGYSAEGTKKVTDAIKNSKGSVEELNEKMKQSPKYKIDELKSAFEGLQLQLADGLAPVATEVLTDVTKKINKMTSSDTFKKENMSNFFNEMLSNIKIGIAAWGALKFSILAATQPCIAAATAGIFAGRWLGKKIGLDKFGAKLGDSWKAKDEEKLRKQIQAQKSDALAASSLYKADFGRDGRDDWNKAMSEKGLPYMTSNSLDKAINSSGVKTQDIVKNISEKKEKTVNLNVNVSGTVMKESLSPDELAQKIADRLNTERITQM